MMILLCKKHPRYAAKKQPRSSCETCWLMWLIKTVTSLQYENACLRQSLYESWL